MLKRVGNELIVLNERGESTRGGIDMTMMNPLVPTPDYDEVTFPDRVRCVDKQELPDGTFRVVFTRAPLPTDEDEDAFVPDDTESAIRITIPTLPAEMASVFYVGSEHDFTGTIRTVV